MKAFALLLLLIAPLTSPAPRDDPFFSRLLGTWIGKGTAFGSPARVQARWESVLEDKYTRLNLNYVYRDSNGAETSFSGHGYYQNKGNGLYEGYWFDTQNNQYPIKATLDGDSLTALWGIPDKIEGRSIYRIVDGGKSLEVVDALKQKDGTWKEFSHFKLKPG